MNFDAVIVSVLRDTEHRALLATFGLDPFSDPDKRDDDVEIWRTKLDRSGDEPLNIALTCMDEKGIRDSYGRTKEILKAVNTKSIYLVGSAGGRKDKTSICHVVVSSKGIMYYEKGRMRAGGTGDKPEYTSPKRLLKNEVKHFDTLYTYTRGWKDEYNSILQNLQQRYSRYNKTLPMPTSEPEVHLNMIASGEKIVNEELMEAICSLNDEVRAAEMEGYGFAKACDESEIEWLVIRGISDFGDREDKENWKTTATVMAASFLKIFLKHASQLPRQGERLESSIYVSQKIPDIVRQELQKKSIDITAVKFSLDLTISDLERICCILYPDMDSKQIRKVVREARAIAFETKYADRTEKDDERFTDIERWKEEFRDLLSDLGIQKFNKKRVINVGISNCLEAEGLFDKIEEFIGIDLSPKALEGAKGNCPKLKCIVNDAEDLHGIENGSQDVYISLRTYQSTLFDINAALFEAYRVLRPGGWIVISISNTFIDETKGILKGLLLPESSEVDPDLPYRFISKIRERLKMLNFESIGMRMGMVEDYIYGQRGR